MSWVVGRLRKKNHERYRDWIAHLRTALADLEDIATIERPEDRHCYMVYQYRGGLRVPSWMVSDGTLRLTALTLPAYLDDLRGIYLIEEPENGIHPSAVATVYDSLSSVYEAQVLLATHSPVVLNAAGMGDVLCFAKDRTGSTDTVLGAEHPKLREWRGEANLGTLLASGVLEGKVTPARPKEAFNEALRAARKPRSPSLYEQIAKKVSLRRCTDKAFLELKGILSQWFPREGQSLSE